LPPALSPTTASWPLPPTASVFSTEPLVGGPAVVVRRGEAVLGALPVGDGDDDRVGRVRERARRGVVDVDVRDHPAAAVDVEEDGERPLAHRRVDPQRDLAAGAGDRALLDAGDGLGIGALALLLEHLRDGVRRCGLLSCLLAP